MFFWAREYPVTGAAKDVEVSERMAIDMYGCYWRPWSHHTN